MEFTALCQRGKSNFHVDLAALEADESKLAGATMVRLHNKDPGQHSQSHPSHRQGAYQLLGGRIVGAKAALQSLQMENWHPILTFLIERLIMPYRAAYAKVK